MFAIPSLDLKFLPAMKALERRVDRDTFCTQEMVGHLGCHANNKAEFSLHRESVGLCTANIALFSWSFIFLIH